jgi:hypothetical protein
MCKELFFLLCPFRNVIYFKTFPEMVEWFRKSGGCKKITWLWQETFSSMKISGLAYSPAFCCQCYDRYKVSCTPPSPPAVWGVNKWAIAHELAHVVLPVPFEAFKKHSIEHRIVTCFIFLHLLLCPLCRNQFKDLPKGSREIALKPRL